MYATRVSKEGLFSDASLPHDVTQKMQELDLLRWSGSGIPLRLLSLSPLLAGLAGLSLTVIKGEDHRVLTFGGASILYPMMEMMEIPQSKSVSRALV